MPTDRATRLQIVVGKTRRQKSQFTFHYSHWHGNEFQDFVIKRSKDLIKDYLIHGISVLKYASVKYLPHYATKLFELVLSDLIPLEMITLGTFRAAKRDFHCPNLSSIRTRVARNVKVGGGQGRF